MTRLFTHAIFFSARPDARRFVPYDKIPVAILEAIERDDVARLPQGFRAETITMAAPPPCESIAPLPLTVEPERRTTTLVRASAVVPETCFRNPRGPIQSPGTDRCSC